MRSIKAKANLRASKYAYQGLDRVIHEHARLSVLTALAAHSRGLRFGDLRQVCGLTDGNLSRHLQILQAAKMVEVSKTFEGNRPATFCRLTAEGRKRYLGYVAVLEQVVEDAAVKRAERSRRRTRAEVNS
jgi:DNA-binding transcriptional ArsR family regulator